MGKQRVVCVFEGGGARGVSHLGVLSALEADSKYKIVGYAGTSAGALIAALAATGYQSKEIFSIKDQKVKSIFDIFPEEFSCKQPKDMFEKFDWLFFRAIRKILKSENFFIKFVFFLSIFLIAVPIIHYCIASIFDRNMIKFELYKLYFHIYSIVISSIFIVVCYFFYFNISGILRTKKFRKLVNYALSLKIGTDADSSVTFRHLRDRDISLKIVASNVTEKKISLFSTDHSATLDVPVADAVAASIAVPLIFHPVIMRDAVYVDGGLLSNLPAWTFDGELLNDEEVWTVSSEVNNAEKRDFSHAPWYRKIPSAIVRWVLRKLTPRRGAERGIVLMKDIASTSIFGAHNLNIRGIKNHIRLPAPASDRPIHLLDFDMPPQQIQEYVRFVELTAAGRLQTPFAEIGHLLKVKEKIKNILTSSGIEVVENDKNSKNWIKNERRLRCALAREVKMNSSDVAAYHLWYCDQFDRCADQFAYINSAGSMIDCCMRQRRKGAVNSLFWDLENESCRDMFYKHTNGYFMKMCPSDLKWAMVVEIRSNVGGLSRAMTIDGNFSVSSILAQKLQDEVNNAIS